jgi:hypothetical protein
VEFAKKMRGYAERTRGYVKSGRNGKGNEHDWNESENDCARKTRS